MATSKDEHGSLSSGNGRTTFLLKVIFINVWHFFSCVLFVILIVDLYFNIYYLML